ncbi:hypothetical protein PTTG_27797 [Puccinia triticina 1-1 BBBD Race 1]|uniref:Uncharacterized protein n=1 Tax=Puccinia triticina (isolate 1-1 / race 1 (BBBD)) TaxID=630390 RepID=A0A180GH50_PUCT1|nr:hypothetical protein PTTG_27797 [Puccinia triticina 1-1 BBBD Race 1]
MDAQPSVSAVRSSLSKVSTPEHLRTATPLSPSNASSISSSPLAESSVSGLAASNHAPRNLPHKPLDHQAADESASKQSEPVAAKLASPVGVPTSNISSPPDFLP